MKKLKNKFFKSCPPTPTPYKMLKIRIAIGSFFLVLHSFALFVSRLYKNELQKNNYFFTLYEKIFAFFAKKSYNEAV